MPELNKGGTDWRRVALASGAALAALGVGNALWSAALTQSRKRGARMTRVGDADLHTIEAGAGETILLIHGNGVTAEDWVLSGVFDRLSARRRVIAVDRPGCGLSSRPRGPLWTAEAQAAALAELMLARKAAPALVVGHSFGVQTALALALDHPDVVLGLVLISGYIVPTPRTDVALFSPPATPVIGDIFRMTLSPLLGLLMTPGVLNGMFKPQKAPAAFKERIVPMSLRPSQLRATGADAAYMTPTAVSQFNRLSEIQAPVTLVIGGQDKIVHSGFHAKSALKRIGDSELVRVEEAGHMVHYAAPDIIADAVEKTFVRAAGALAAHRLAGQPAREQMTS